MKLMEVTLLSTDEKPSPKRGEIWYVNLDPTIGAEMKKIRPVVVINSDAIGRLPVKLIAPITKWKEWCDEHSWFVTIQPNDVNGLAEKSAVDTLQIRGISVERFINKRGYLGASEMEEIITAIAIVIEYV